MNLKSRISRIEETMEKRFDTGGGRCTCTINGSRMERWEQYVDGNVSKPITEPERVGPVAETFCRECGGETQVIQLCVVKNRNDDENIGVRFDDGKEFGGIDYDRI